MKKLLPQLGLLFLLLLPLLGRAQEIRISGRVVDAETKAPIPYVSISLLDEESGALSDEEGYFHFLTSARSTKDSLIVVTLGYNREIVLLDLSKAIELIVELRAKSKSELSVLEYPIFMALPGNQYGFYLNKNLKDKLGKLSAFSFYVDYSGLPHEEFRLRLYKADGPNHSPKTDLLLEPVFIDKIKSRAWNTIDLRSFSMDLPDEGFYLVFEYLSGTGGPNHVAYLDALPEAGAILRLSIAMKECSIWMQGPGHWDLNKGKRGAYVFDAWTLNKTSCEEFRKLANSIKVEVDCTE